MKFYEVITKNSFFTTLLQYIKCKCVCEGESFGVLPKEVNILAMNYRLLMSLRFEY